MFLIWEVARQKKNTNHPLEKEHKLFHPNGLKKRSFVTNLTIINYYQDFFWILWYQKFGRIFQQNSKSSRIYTQKKTTKFCQKKITRLPEASFQFLVPATVKKKHSFNYRNRNHSRTQRRNRKSFTYSQEEQKIIHSSHGVWNHSSP